MSPRGRWVDYYEAQPRRAVQGGVVVAKPGKVTDPVAMEVVEAAAMETSDKILAAGGPTHAPGRSWRSTPIRTRSPRRSRARRGHRMKCVSIAQSSPGPTGWQPTAPVPTAATTTGANTPRLWHTSPRSCWTATRTCARSGPAGTRCRRRVRAAPPPVVLDTDELEALRRPPPQVDALALLAAADAVVPHPLGSRVGAARP